MEDVSPREQLFSATSMIGSLARLFGAVAVGMSLYELLKQIAFPHITIWVSHAVTIGVSSCASTIAGYLVMRVMWRTSKEQLRTRDERFQLVSRATNDSVWDWDLASNAIWWSDSEYKNFGFNREDIRPNAAWWQEHIHPEDRESVLDGARAAIEGGKTNWSAEYRYRRADGSYAHVLDRGYVMRRPDGSAVRMVGVKADISERKRADDELRASEERYRMLFHQNLAGVFRSTLDGRMLDCNEAFARILGYDSIQNVLPIHAPDLYYFPDDRLRITQELRAGEAVTNAELRARHKDGRLLWVLMSMNLTSLGDGSIQGTLIDITTRKQTEQELIDAKETAENANRLKSEFLANISHEIRTPMNGIIGMTKLTLDTELSSEQREYLATVITSAEHLMRVINDILDFSKIEAGKLDLANTEFALGDCLDETLQSLSLPAWQKGLEVICDVRPNVPERLRGDPGRLQQIVLNLAGNAIKFTEHGEVLLRVETEVQETDRVCLHFSIRDTGIGIAPDKRLLIFEPFTQADGTSTRQYGGTGLGLSISTQLVELMGGRNWVDSEIGRGSTFHFTARFGQATGAVPVEPQLSDAFQPGIKPIDLGLPGPANTVVGRNQRHFRILLAEDNPANLAVALAMLGKRGHTVTVARNGRDALAVLEKNGDGEFDLLLLDIQMPEMNGYEVAAAIRQAEHQTDTHLPIIALTALAMPGDEQKCLAAGMDAYISKPIRMAQLMTAMESLVPLGSEAVERSSVPAESSVVGAGRFVSRG